MTYKIATLILAFILTACVMTAPDHVAGKFCRLSTNPNDNAMKNILSRDLRTLWEQAQAHSDDWAAKNPGEKPPLGDGIHTQAFVDHAPICKVDGLSGQGDHREAGIYHGFPDDPEAGWTDRLILKVEDASWVIDDVLYAPNHETGLRHSLSAILKE